MKINYVIVGLLLFTLSSCGLYKKKEIVSTNELLFSKWKAKEINGQSIASQVNGVNHYISFEKDNSHYTAITGCNNMSGSFSLSKNKIKFGQGISTMMACTDMTVENGLRHLFQQATYYTISNNELVFLDSKSKVQGRFELMTENNSKSLAGEWILDYMAETDKPFDTLFPNKKPTLTFDTKDMTFSGNGSCNSFSGTFTKEASKLLFGPIASTKMACPTLEGESNFLKNLRKVNKYSIHENTLTLIMGDIAIIRLKKK